MSNSNPFKGVSGPLVVLAGFVASASFSPALAQSAASPSITLTASAREVAVNRTSRLSWTTTGAQRCVGSGPGWNQTYEGTAAARGAFTTPALTARTNEFSLSCTGPGGSSVQRVTVAALPAPKVTLEASSTRALPGGSVQLSWRSEDATGCTASGAPFTGTKPTQGNETLSALTKGTKKFSLSCRGVGGTTRATTEVAVVAAPTLNFSASKTQIAENTSTQLKWKATDATSCVASGDWSGPQSASGSLNTGNLSSDKTYTLTCSGLNGEAEETVTVEVVAAPIVSLAISDDIVAPGESVTLSWDVDDAQSCTASGAPFTGAKDIRGGSETLSNLTKGNKTFKLTCRGGGGTTVAEAKLAVIAPPTLTFSASKTQIAENTSTQLKWKATDATSCVASGDWSGPQSASGSFTTGNLSSDKIYTLSCAGLNGEVERSVTVEVIPAPTVTLTVSDELIVPGESVTITWEVEDAQSCTASGSPFTGSKNASGSSETLSNLTKGNKTFKLTCRGVGGTTVAEAKLGVFPLPEILSFTADPTPVQAGQTTTLKWQTQETSACTASGAWTGPQARNSTGTASEPLTQRTNVFTLTCTGDGGEISSSVTVEARGAPEVSLSIDRTLITSGEKATLTWTSAEATSCTASGAWSGTKTLSGTEASTALEPGNYTFTLRCVNAVGSDTKSVSVESAKPQAAIDLTTLAFGDTGVGVTPRRSVKVTNTGKVALTALSATLGGTNADQFVLTSSCGVTLAPTAECSVEVTFRPTSGGAKSANLEIKGAGANPLAIALTGTAAFQTLNVSKSGGGNGTVTSIPAGIDCGNTCSANFNIGTSVTLTATAANDSTFTGWSGACTGTAACTVTISEARSVTATFALKTFALTVTKAGTGSGSVTSVPAGIDCGNTCSANFNTGTSVTLTVSAANDSTFTGWTGCARTNGNACTVTVDQAKSVTANFDRVAIRGKVIDGYIKGARVFVDMNWSMQYEEGEPVAESDDSGNWVLNPSQLAGFSCYADANGPRPIIASVPTSALDKARGVVKKPFNLVFLPPSWLGLNLPGGAANLTPFTTLFSTAISNAGGGRGLGTTPIPVDQACGGDANAIADRVRTQMSRLGEAIVGAGFSTQKLYDDYIASNDATAQRKGEVLVDYLTRSLEITQILVEAIRQEVGITERIFSTSGFSTEAITAILGDSVPSVLPFDLRSSAQGIAVPGGGVGFLHIDVEGIRLRSNGDGIAFNCTESDPAKCSAVPLQSADQIYKAAKYVFKDVKLGDGRGLTFAKGLKDGKVDCENRVRFDYEPMKTSDVDPSKLTKRELAQLEFIYKMPIENGFSRFGCETGDVGLSITKAIVYPPTTEGNYYSLFRFGGQPTEDRITQLLSYWSAYSRGDFIKTPFDRQRAIDELAALPSTPNELPKIEEQLGSSGWYLLTGSKQRDYLLQSSNSNYVCTITAVNNASQVFSVTEGAGAIAACYSDLSVFGLPVRLKVSTVDTGGRTGKIVSSPAGIDCKSCSADFPVGASVTLTAVPSDADSAFQSWGGACSGSGSCVVSMTEPKSVTATFALKTFVLSVTKAGNGSGAVTSSPAGIDCGSTCSANYNTGTSVTLTATAANDSTFTGWGGACNGTNSCTITMSEARSVTATFSARPATNESISVSTSSLVFGSVRVGSFSWTRSLIVKNIGTSPVAVTPSILGFAEDEITLSNASCLSSINAGAQCFLGLTMRPKSSGSKLGQLRLAAATSNVIVELRGRAGQSENQFVCRADPDQSEPLPATGVLDITVNSKTNSNAATQEFWMDQTPLPDASSYQVELKWEVGGTNSSTLTWSNIAQSATKSCARLTFAVTPSSGSASLQSTDPCGYALAVPFVSGSSKALMRVTADGRTINDSVIIGNSKPDKTLLVGSPFLGRVLFEWARVEGATDYVIYKIEGENATPYVDTTDAYKELNLALDTTHTFAVKARSSVGSSAFSNPVTVTPRSATAINVQIDDIVVNQAVEVGTSATTKLIAGKPGVVQVYLRVSGDIIGYPGVITLEAPGLETITMIGPLMNTPITAGPGAACVATFDLRDDASTWFASGSRSLTASVHLVGAASAAQPTSNTPVSTSKAFNFVDERPLYVKLIPVNSVRGNPTSAEIELAKTSIEKQLKAMYPNRSPQVVLSAAPYQFTGTDPGSSFLSDLLPKIRDVRAAELSNAGCDRFYYGLHKDNKSLGARTIGLAYVPTLSSIVANSCPPLAGIGVIEYPLTIDTTAHEIGHNHGRIHVSSSGETNDNCGSPGSTDPGYPYPKGRIGVTGYDSAGHRALSKNFFHDIMSYCSRNWISDYQYRALRSFQESLSVLAPAAGLIADARMSSATGGVLFSGSIDVQGVWRLGSRLALGGRRTAADGASRGFSARVVLTNDTEQALPLEIVDIDHAARRDFSIWLSNDLAAKEIVVRSSDGSVVFRWDVSTERMTAALSTGAGYLIVGSTVEILPWGSGDRLVIRIRGNEREFVANDGGSETLRLEFVPGDLFEVVATTTERRMLIGPLDGEASSRVIDSSLAARVIWPAITSGSSTSGGKDSKSALQGIVGTPSLTSTELDSGTTTQEGAMTVSALEISESEDPMTGSRYVLSRSTESGPGGYAWVLGYRSGSGALLNQWGLQSTSGVLWRRAEGASLELPNSGWVASCSGQVWVIRDGYELLAARADASLISRSEFGVDLGDANQVKIVESVSCHRDQGLKVSGILLPVTNSSPLLQSQPVDAVRFEAEVDPAGVVISQHLASTEFGFTSYCTLPTPRERALVCGQALGPAN